MSGDAITEARACWTHSANGIHVFGPVSFTVPDGEGLAPQLLLSEHDQQTWKSKGELLRPFRIVSGTRAIIRDGGAAPGVPPLSASELLGRGILLTSVIKLEIKATTIAGSTNYIIDAGQTLELYADTISVRALAPKESYVVPAESTGPEQRRPRAGLVFDTFVGVGIMTIDNFVGNLDAHHTQTIRLAENIPGAIEIPAYARRLTIYQTGAVGPTLMQWTMGGPTVPSIALGEIQFNAAGQLLRNNVRRPQATHVQIAANTQARTFTFVWTIKP